MPRYIFSYNLIQTHEKERINILNLYIYTSQKKTDQFNIFFYKEFFLDTYE